MQAFEGELEVAGRVLFDFRSEGVRWIALGASMLAIRNLGIVRLPEEWASSVLWLV